MILKDNYIIQHNERIIPIEVKSGIRGKMQSIRLFIAEHNTKKGIRLSLENFAAYEDIDVYPLYAVSNILKNDLMNGVKKRLTVLL